MFALNLKTSLTVFGGWIRVGVEIWIITDDFSTVCRFHYRLDWCLVLNWLFLGSKQSIIKPSLFIRLNAENPKYNRKITDAQLSIGTSQWPIRSSSIVKNVVLIRIKFIIAFSSVRKNVFGHWGAPCLPKSCSARCYSTITVVNALLYEWFEITIR